MADNQRNTHQTTGFTRYEPMLDSSPQEPDPTEHMHPHMVMLVIAIIVIITISVVTASFLISSKNSQSSYAHTTASSPTMSHTKTMLLNYLAESNSIQNVEVSYVVTSYGSFTNSFNVSRYVLGNDSKAVSTINIPGFSSVVAVYNVHNMTITCTESGNSTISCLLANTTGNSASLTNTQIISLPGVTVNYLGTSTVLNRSCDLFTTSGNLGLLTATSNTSTSSANSNTTFDIRMCVDKQTGTLLDTNMSETLHSSSGNQTITLTSLKATAFSIGTVTRADLALPVNTVLAETRNTSGTLTYLNCNSTALSFQVMPAVALSKLNINGTESVYNSTTNTYANTTLFNTTRTGNYDAFSLYKITVPESIVPQQQVNICVNGACNIGLSCNA